MKKFIETFKNIFKIEELRKRIVYTLLLVLVYRLGCFVVIPGIDASGLATLQSNTQDGLVGLLNMFSGGAFGNASIFALGVMPYISASIVIQLLGMFVPYFSDASLSCARYSYNILEGRNAANAIAALMTKTGTNRVIINSESEAFVNDAVRNLDMLVYRKYNVVLYSPSKIRSFETIDIENLHNLKTRVSTSYFIDYESPEVRHFLMEYRALYNTEPTQFSFQGYDLTYFFIKMKSTYGKKWMENVARMGNTAMMQTDFLFRELGNGGYVNEGVRRIVYGPDYSIRIVKK